jgi:pimeloyl-ACP methyl ester carboxylesterase
MRSGIKRWVGGIVISTAAVYLAGGAFVWRFPDRFVPAPEPAAARTPGAVGLRYADVWLDAGPRGALVHGWWVPNGEGAPVILMLPGIGRPMAGSLPVALALHRAGAAVLMIDYRGFGRSARALPSEATMLEDARAAWQQMRWFQGDPARSLLYGHSLGAAIALELAAGNPDVAGVILEGAPTSVADLLARSLVARIYPVGWLTRGRFDVAAKLERVAAPILFVHGRDDAVVPAAMSAELHRRAKNPGALLVVDRARHGDAAIVDAEAYSAAVERLLPPRQVLALRSSAATMVRRSERQGERRFPAPDTGPASPSASANALSPRT